MNTIRNLGIRVGCARRAQLAALLTVAAFAALTSQKMIAERVLSLTADTPGSSTEAVAGCSATREESHPNAPCPSNEPLIVIGFMGGHIRAGNLAHGEARLARDLLQRYPAAVDAMTFANRHEPEALRTVLSLLNTSKDGRLSDAEKSAARIVIFGHSWGASETVQFAKELNRRGIPVLLTIQVDSVEKSGEDDGSIPPNVREAINFYQSEGFLHGRSSIQAIDPKRTKILGSYESKYKSSPVSCTGYSWYARAFMKPHIEIENDGALWDRIEALIVSHARAANPVGMASVSAEK